jgi:inosine-uridine nucleoside N-ribohydrolase
VLFVIAHKNFQPLGITVTHGNTPARAKMACKVLHLTGRGNIPVYVGRRTEQKEYSHQFVWAEDFAAKRPDATKAADFIVETVRRYPGEVTLVAVGPVQNIADALRKEPQLGKMVKRVVLMSGCLWHRRKQHHRGIRRVFVTDSNWSMRGLAVDDRTSGFHDSCQAQRPNGRLQKYSSP